MGERGLRPEHIRDLDDLSRLPILTKATARKRGSDLYASAGYREAVTAVLDASPDLASSRREELLERVVDLMPDDEELRKSRGDVRDGSRWVLAETVEARQRRKAIAEEVRAAFRGAESLRPHTSGLSDGWAWACDVGPRVVTGDTPIEEGQRAAQVAAATEAFLKGLLGLKDGTARGRSLYVFADPATGRKWVRKNEHDPDALPGLDDVSSLWLKNGDLIILGKTRDDRINSIAQQLTDATLKLATSRESLAWVTQGTTQRLLWRLLGQHGRPFVVFEGTDRPDDAIDRTALPDRDASWDRAAFAAYDRAHVADFRSLFTRAINAFRPSDVLLAYGLSAYLLEARPEQFVEFLQAASTLSGADEVCQSVFRLDADVLYWRVRRWLSEQ